MSSLPILTHDYVLVNPMRNKPPKVPVAELIINASKKFGKQTALIHATSGEKVTYNDVIRDGIKIAASLMSKGVRPGDVIGICSENRLEYAPAVLGILACGASLAPLNPLYNKDELLHTTSISKPQKIFVSPFFAANIIANKPEIQSLNEVIVFGEADKPGVTSYSSLLKNSATVSNFRFPNINPEETVAFLFCSSGTTGLPKCVELTHMNFLYFLDFFRTNFEQDSIPGKNATLGLVPFFHAYGCSVMLFCLFTGTLNVIMSRFEEEVFLNSIQKYKISHLYLVPPLVLFLAKHPMVAKYNFSSVRSIICGAAPLSRETQLAAQNRLKLKFEIYQGYGMTEMSVCCVAPIKNSKKIGSSGVIAPGLDCKMVDLSTGKALPPYQQGEICFKGPFVMKGYKGNPKATQETFDSDGWFHTGDIGYYDSDGFIFIVDRLKELIKYKGFQVPPAELETLLINHPLIKDAAVIGIPDEAAGELPLAFVVKQPGANITEEEVKKYIAGKVSPQKRLHGGVRFMNEIPKNPSGKILRRELRALVKSKL